MAKNYYYYYYFNYFPNFEGAFLVALGSMSINHVYVMCIDVVS
jgi:hypothetical protein